MKTSGGCIESNHRLENEKKSLFSFTLILDFRVKNFCRFGLVEIE
jgi:hypothetical protein